jgi:hypothetical protein
MTRATTRRLSWLLLALSLAVPLPAGAETPAAAPRAVAVEPRFGAVDAFYDANRADELGVGWSRLMFPWQRVQRIGPQEFWPAISEDIINDEVRRGRKLVGVLVNTPDWASSGKGRTLTSPPRGLDLPIDDPGNYWAQYVKRTAQFYRGRVDTWTIWNEPDVSDTEHPGYTWSGSVEEFYQLQKVAYLAAKRGNPSAKVILPGLTYWWDKRFERPQYFQRLLDVAIKDPEGPANGWFFDAAVLQLYNEPQLLYDVPNEYRRIMEAHGVDKPIWINETNVAPWDDPDRPLTRAHFRANGLEQASYLIQAYSLALAAGVERIQLYKLRDEDEWHFGWESYGVVRNDHSVRPGFKALQMVHKVFATAHRGTVRNEGAARVVTLPTADGRITVAWARNPRPAVLRVQAGAPAATVCGREGECRTVEPTAGWYQFDLPAATHNTVAGRPEVYQIGGAPMVIVERGATGEAPVKVEDGPPIVTAEPLSALARALEYLRGAAPLFR